MVQRFLILAVLLTAPLFAAGQAAYEAERRPVSLSMGGSYSFFDADYGGYHMMGASAYVDFSSLICDHVSGEAEGRWLTFNGSQGFREYNYLIGPLYKISLSERHRLHPYVKALLGQGDIDFPNHLAYGRYFVFAPGSGVDISIRRRLKLRADYEYQIWPDAPGIPGLPSQGMKPNGVSVGFTYRVF